MLKAKASRAVLKASRRFHRRSPSPVQDCPPGKVHARRKKKKPLRAHAAGRRHHDSCAAQWREVEREADAIAGSPDPIYRNAVITKTYARLFQRRPDMRWFGLAVFGSKQVGCVLRKAKSWIDLSLLDLVPHPLIRGVRQARRFAATVMYKRLAEGNAAVFHDLYPLGRFYEKHGLKGLRRCRNARDPRVPQPLIKAFESIRHGHPLDGAWRMVRHEQEVTLQHSVYGHREVKALLVSNYGLLKAGKAGQILGALSMKSVLAASCDDGPTIPFRGSNLADVGQRREFVKEVMETFNRLYDPNNPHNRRKQIDDAIAQLKQSGRPPEGD